MIIVFTRDESFYLNFEDYSISEHCPDDIRKTIEEKLELMKKPFIRSEDDEEK